MPAFPRLCGCDGRMSEIVTATVDAAGHLIAADPRLEALHRDAGGEPGGRVAIPQIATLARLARTLAIPVSRPVMVADGNRTLDLHVRARLSEGLVYLAVTGWDNVVIPEPDDMTESGREHDFARLEADGAWETDRNLRVTRLSGGVDANFGAGFGNFQGKPFAAVFALMQDDDGDVPLLAALAQRVAFKGQRAELAGLGQHVVEIAGEPVFDAAGHFSGLRGTLTRLGHSSNAGDADSGASAVVHDGFAERLDTALRTPLGRIVSNADAIGEQGAGPLRHDYVDYSKDIASAGRHLLGLVDDLVDLQAIERSDFKVETERLDLADVARRAAGLLSVRAADKHVKIDRPDDDEELIASGDFRRVLQILVNLIGNAVRYSPEGSMVWIRTEVEEDLAVIVVADQGQGIALQDQDRIFVKFERVDPSEPGGSGLGLYISRRLARAMGGDITVDSAPGFGARFALTLPIRP
jgi:nitrogen-specific signal transduction histidine kinase